MWYHVICYKPTDVSGERALSILRLDSAHFLLVGSSHKFLQNVGKYQITKYHNPEDSTLHWYDCKKLTFNLPDTVSPRLSHPVLRTNVVFWLSFLALRLSCPVHDVDKSCAGESCSQSLEGADTNCLEKRGLIWRNFESGKLNHYFGLSLWSRDRGKWSNLSWQEGSKQANFYQAMQCHIPVPTMRIWDRRK
jgi:hypothetical protein